MSLTISLPSGAEERLRERASAAGQDVSTYAEQLIIRELDAPLSLVEASKPIADAVEYAGVSDDEFLSAINEARDAARNARRRDPS